MGLALIAFVGLVNVYAQRINMSVAVVCMLNHTAIMSESVPVDTTFGNGSSLAKVDDQCAVQKDNGTITSGKMDGPFEWTKSQQGLVLGAFFWGYILTQVPGGLLAERFGGKRVFLYFMLFGAVCTLLCPLAANVHIVLFMIMRILLGIGEGVVFPAMHAMWSHWAPPLERSILIGCSYSGTQLGNVIALPLSGYLCAVTGWQSIFYAFGIFGVIWCIAWHFLTSDTPASHPRISRLELTYIQKSLAGQQNEDESHSHRVPWLLIASSPAVWAIVVSHTCANFGTYLLLTTLPSYMKQVLRFDIKSNGLLSAIPYIAFFVVIQFAAVIADWLRAGNRLSTAVVRKGAMVISMFGQALFLILAGYCKCGQEVLAVTFITVAQGISGIQFAGFTVNHVDIAPRYAGTLFAIGNTAATVSGIVAPYVAAALTPDGTLEQWRLVFWVAGGILCFGAVFFVIFGSGRLQPWAVVDIQHENVDVPIKPTNHDTK